MTFEFLPDARSKRLHNLIIIAVALDDGSVENVRAESNKAVVGARVSGYQNPANSADIRIEGLTQSVPPRFMLSVAALFISAFVLMPFGLITVFASSVNEKAIETFTEAALRNKTGT